MKQEKKLSHDLWHQVEVVENVLLCSDHYRLRMRDDGRISKTCRPGQFVNLSIPDREDLLLRRPFSIAMSKPDQSLFEVVYRVVGKGTAAMTGFKPGEIVDILGPFGKAFTIPEGNKKCLLIGGGCGVAPLWGLAERLSLSGNNVIALMGFQSKNKVFGEEVFRHFCSETFIATDDGSYGLKGFVSVHLGKILEKTLDRAFLCGPTPMFKAVLPMIKKARLKGEVSLEERMGCGFGVCLSCVAGILKDGVVEKQRVCTEGPVFDLEEVVWNDEA
jgi:dihydroorotate dehydrogenase electron transfer subunit